MLISLYFSKSCLVFSKLDRKVSYFFDKNRSEIQKMQFLIKKSVPWARADVEQHNTAVEEDIAVEEDMPLDKLQETVCIVMGGIRNQPTDCKQRCCSFVSAPSLLQSDTPACSKAKRYCCACHQRCQLPKISQDTVDIKSRCITNTCFFISLVSLLFFQKVEHILAYHLHTIKIVFLYERKFAKIWGHNKRTRKYCGNTGDSRVKHTLRIVA